MTTAYHAKYFASELTKRCPSDSVEKLAASLADEVGLGKTISRGTLNALIKELEDVIGTDNNMTLWLSTF